MESTNRTSGLTPQEALNKRKINFAVIGFVWALVAAITWAFQGNLMGIAGGMEPFTVGTYSVMMLALASIVTGGLHDLFAGVWLFFINLGTGRGLKETGRLLSTKIGAMTLLGAFFGGPMATGCYLVGVNLCGVTYAAALGGISPIVGAFAGRLLFKERLNFRVWIGVVLAVLGVLIVSYSPPSGDHPYFVVGLIFSLFASIGWGLEGVCATYASDMTDSATACGIYRTFGSAFMTFILLVPIFGVLAGDVGAGFKIVAQAFADVTPIVWVAIAAIAGGVSYVTLYNAFPRTGVARSLTVDVTYTLWSIPVGFLFAAIGLSDYSIAGRAIIGCVIIFVGVVLVIGNPKELVKLRDN